jgi:hypothetical protein
MRYRIISGWIQSSDSLPDVYECTQGGVCKEIKKIKTACLIIPFHLSPFHTRRRWTSCTPRTQVQRSVPWRSCQPQHGAEGAPVWPHAHRRVESRRVNHGRIGPNRSADSCLEFGDTHLQQQPNIQGNISASSLHRELIGLLSDAMLLCYFGSSCVMASYVDLIGMYVFSLRQHAHNTHSHHPSRTV